MPITLEQHNLAPTNQEVDSIANWIMVFSSPLKRKFPYQEQISNRYKQIAHNSESPIPVVIDLPNKNSSHVSFTKVLSLDLEFTPLGFDLSYFLFTLWPVIFSNIVTN